MKPLPLDIPPGVRRIATHQAARGFWADANLIRWQNGTAQPVGGWLRLANLELPAPAYGMLAWYANNGTRLLAIGTRDKLFVYDGTLTEITPAGGLAALAPPGPAIGYGIGPYGAGTYGTPRFDLAGPGAAITPGDAWFLDNWGEDLLAVSSADGRLLRWSPGDAEAAPVAGAPDGARGVIVTDERHVVLLGTSALPRSVVWSDQEDLAEWAPGVDNLAGSLEVRCSGVPFTAKRGREGVVILTPVSAHLLRYVGPPFAYALDRLGSGIGAIGARAIVASQGVVGWMGAQNFHIYDGTVRIIPCQARDLIFPHMNRQKAGLAFAQVFGAHGEVWWFYPSESSTECDRYAIWNFASGENVWSVGRLRRTCGVDGGAFAWPLLGDEAGFVQAHERGWTADGASRIGDVWAETGDIQIADGERYSIVTEAWPDADPETEPDAIRLAFTFLDKPKGRQWTRGPYPLQRADGKVDVRGRGRAMRLRVEAGADGYFGLGRVRLGITPGERR